MFFKDEDNVVIAWTHDEIQRLDGWDEAFLNALWNVFPQGKTEDEGTLRRIRYLCHETTGLIGLKCVPQRGKDQSWHCQRRIKGVEVQEKFRKGGAKTA